MAKTLGEFEQVLLFSVLRLGDDGFEYLEVDGHASERTRPGSLGMLGAMGEDAAQMSAQRKYMDNIPYGGGDAAERIELIQKENLQKVVLFSAGNSEAIENELGSHLGLEGYLRFWLGAEQAYLEEGLRRVAEELSGAESKITTAA